MLFASREPRAANAAASEEMWFNVIQAQNAFVR